MKRVVIGLMGRVRVSKNNPELGRNSRRTPPESGFSWIRPMSIEIRLSSGELYIPAKLSFDSVFQPYTFPWSQQTRIQQQLTPRSSCSSIPTNSDSNAGEPKARRLSKRLKTYPTSDKQYTNIIQASNNNSIQQIIKKQTGKRRTQRRRSFSGEHQNKHQHIQNSYVQTRNGMIYQYPTSKFMNSQQKLNPQNRILNRKLNFENNTSFNRFDERCI